MWYSKGSINPSAETNEGDNQQSDTPSTVNISTSVSDGTDAIDSVTVTLTDTEDDTKTFTGTTGSAGGCTLSNVPIGTYTVTASKEGYVEYTDSLTVTEETTTLTITLEAITTP